MQMDKKKRRAMQKKKQIRRRIIFGAILIVLIASGVSIYAHERNTDKDTKTATIQQDQSKQKNTSEETKQEAPKPTDIMPGQNIIYAANSYAVPANDVYRMINTGDKVNDEKEVFLTFDDGPSENTSNILKILKEENVHATFFVLGSQLKNNPKNQQLLKDEIDSGNALANHTMSHDYRILYPGNSVNVTRFMNEINENNEQMKEILGQNFNTRVLRMPGGYMSRKYYNDPNLKKLNAAMNKEGILSIDWDAETGDAESNTYSVEYLISRARRSLNQKHVVLLMHDAAAKKSTVKALPSIIKMYKENGYKFKVIKNAPMSYFKSENKAQTSTKQTSVSASNSSNAQTTATENEINSSADTTTK